jgi:hypothetical protein
MILVFLNVTVIELMQNMWQDFKHSGIRRVLSVTINNKIILNAIRDELIEIDINCYCNTIVISLYFFCVRNSKQINLRHFLSLQSTVIHFFHNFKIISPSTHISSIFSLSFHYSTYFSSIFSISFQNFLLYFPILSTLQLGFLQNMEER